MVLYTEKCWSSLVLVPASGEASSNSGYESRVCSCGGCDNGTESPGGAGLNAEYIFGYSILCLYCHVEASGISHAKIAVAEVIATFTPHHRDSNRHRPVRTF